MKQHHLAAGIGIAFLFGCMIATQRQFVILWGTSAMLFILLAFLTRR